jgi:hypothetical protein
MRLEFRGSREEERGSDFVLGGGEGVAVLWVLVLLLDELFWVSPARQPAHSFKPGLCFRIYSRYGKTRLSRDKRANGKRQNAAKFKNQRLHLLYLTIVRETYGSFSR